MARQDSTELLGRSPSRLVAALIPVWRILAAVALVQLVGSGVSFLIGLHHSVFMNFWLGGALATPLGFLVGLLWHLADDRRRRETQIGVVVFLGVLSVSLGMAALTDTLPRMKAEMSGLAALQSLPEGATKRISVYDRYGEKPLVRIDDQADVSEFVLGCRNVRGYLPNHPMYTETWYLVLEGEERFELECGYEQDHLDAVTGHFVHKIGNSTTYHGAFISRELRPWFQQNIEGRHPAMHGAAPAVVSISPYSQSYSGNLTTCRVSLAL